MSNSFFRDTDVETALGVQALYWGEGVYYLYKRKALAVKNLPANAGDIRDTGSIPGSERSPGGRHGSPLQYSCLENQMDRGPGGLESIGSQRVRHNWSDLAQHNRKIKGEEVCLDKESFQSGMLQWHLWKKRKQEDWAGRAQTVIQFQQNLSQLGRTRANGSPLKSLQLDKNGHTAFLPWSFFSRSCQGRVWFWLTCYPNS